MIKKGDVLERINDCYGKMIIGSQGVVDYVDGRNVRFKGDTETYALQFYKLVKKGGLKMDIIKQYFDKHQDALITLAIVIVVDNFLFGGAFREKIKKSLEKMLHNTEKQLTGKE